MPTMTLKIYSETDKNKVVKVHKAESYDLMFGTVEDIIDIIDVDKLKDAKSIAMVVIKCWGQLKPFLKDVFPGLTDEELKHVKMKELIVTFSQIFRQIVDDFNLIKSGN